MSERALDAVAAMGKVRLTRERLSHLTFKLLNISPPVSGSDHSPLAADAAVRLVGVVRKAEAQIREQEMAAPSGSVAADSPA